MTDTIRAIVVDPTKRTIEEVRLPTRPGNGGAFREIIGCETLESFYLRCGEIVMVDGEALLADPAPQDFWQYENSAPIGSIGVISGHDVMTDTASDTTLSLDKVRKAVTFTRRIVRGMDVHEMEHGIRVELVAPIVEEGKGR